MSEETAEYIVYGEEWEREVMKMPKKAIVDMLRQVLQENEKGIKQ